MSQNHADSPRFLVSFKGLGEAPERGRRSIRKPLLYPLSYGGK
jgi:hypothetical protein